MKKIELLAPCGNMQSLKTALALKADAVYFGMTSFNARLKADNFGEELEQIVAYIHMHGAKAYLTLNTIIENSDGEDLLKTVQKALNAGIDAFIVQDFGVCNLIKKSYPSACIHTSTQMAVNNYLGAIYAQKMGAERVVLSRETTLEDIKLIKQKTNLEIEYFIQGALCVCLSGNCYMSSYLFGKSGNKGECMQPCRLPYKAVLKGKEIANGYLLSAKDINMSKRLKELIDAGVDSFKIEGRLRRPAYVATAVSTYREIIDKNYEVSAKNELELKKAFNRGDFCEGYLNGNGNIIDKNIQGHKGIEIGEVVDFEQGKKFNVVKIKSNHKIVKGDALKFILNEKEEASISPQDIKIVNGLYVITTTAKVSKSAKVRLILDFIEESKEINFNTLPVDFTLMANKNEQLTLRAIFNNKEYSVVGEKCDEAISAPLNKEQTLASLQKLSGTPFYVNSLNLITNGVFVRKQELNELRRKIVEIITNDYINKNKFNLELNYLKNELNKPIFNKKNYTLEINNKYNSNAQFYVVKPSNYANFNYEKIEHKNAFLFVPSFLNNNDINLINKILENNPNLGVYADNIGALQLNRKTILGAKLNIKNIFAVNELLNDNVVAIHMSPELLEQNFEIINKHFNKPVIKSGFDNFELMTLIHCPIKTIYNNECNSCKFNDQIEYVMQNRKTFALKRYVLSKCYFSLVKK